MHFFCAFYSSFCASFQAAKQSIKSGPLHRDQLPSKAEDPRNSSRNYGCLGVASAESSRKLWFVVCKETVFLANSMPILPCSPLICGISQASRGKECGEKSTRCTERLPIVQWSQYVFKNRVSYASIPQTAKPLD